MRAHLATAARRDGALALALLAVYGTIAAFRLVDSDEGFYLMAARQVMDGQLLYHDFHYAQMPLLPYAYAAWLTLTGLGWYAARAFSVMLAVALGLLVARHVEALTGRRALGAGAALVLALTGFAFVWYPTVKTFSLSILLLFGAYVAIERPGRHGAALGGLLLALSAGVRLYVIALVPVFAVGVWRRTRGGRDGALELTRFGVGLAAGLLPVEYFALFDLDTFVFNVFAIHGISAGVDYVALPQKTTAILQTLGFAVHSPNAASAMQFAMLVAVNLALAASALARRERLPLAAIVAGALGLVSFVPMAFYAQYVCMLLPFMVVDAALFVDRLARDLTAAPRAARRLCHLAALLLVAYVGAAVLEAYRYTVTGEQVEGVFTPDNARNWRISSIREVGRAVDGLMPPNRRDVLALWPGYFVESRTTVVPGLESPWALWLSIRLTPQEHVKYHFMSWDEFAYRIVRHENPVVVIGNIAMPDLPIGWARQFLMRSGYAVARRVADVEIYALPARR